MHPALARMDYTKDRTDPPSNAAERKSDRKSQNLAFTSHCAQWMRAAHVIDRNDSRFAKGLKLLGKSDWFCAPRNGLVK
jgi:hypothetical protein